MSLLTILSTLLIGPLKLIFEIIYVTANNIIDHPGWSIVVLSLVMNILVLPLYRRADAMQEASRDMEAKLEKGVKHIKKYFSGDERMMILQTYYRQNNYKPTDALNGSVSLLLEVPFFMAAYQFLSTLTLLQGASLGPIADLSVPDYLLHFMGRNINVLPLLMTLVNVISSAIYLKGYPLKTKIQLYGMALFFLVFLYKSPSGLVFYWTLNNVFSLVKTIFYKLPNPAKMAARLCSAAGTVVLAIGIWNSGEGVAEARMLLILVGVVMQCPLILPKLKVQKTEETQVPNRKNFVLGCMFLTVLIGCLIPSTFIAASPQEYVDLSHFYNPLWYVVNSACLAAGFFLVWIQVFYWLASFRGKVVFERLIIALCAITLVNYMFFGTDLGIISADLQYLDGLSFTGAEKLTNALVIAVVAAVMLYCCKRWERFAIPAIVTAVIALGGMSLLNVSAIKDSIDNITLAQPGQESKTEKETIEPEQLTDSDIPWFNLSTSGQNVVVIMLDRAMGAYIPYLFNEKPELVDQYDGFTYYSNTVSFGRSTNIAASALLGGYEYTPVEMNKRSAESLVEKHNEAIKLMPAIFTEQGYQVTVCNPVLANYQWATDPTVFREYPEVKVFDMSGCFSDAGTAIFNISSTNRNFFCFSLMKTMPLCIQEWIYDEGCYHQAEDGMVQVTDGIYNASGVNYSFVDKYNTLANMHRMTKVVEGDSNTFLFMENSATHEPMMLQEPEYIPSAIVDNKDYEKENQDRFTVDGRTLVVENENQIISYQSNMAAMIQLGKWFDYLREQGVYDNTRIILVADHGRIYAHLSELKLGEKPWEGTHAEGMYPLLMVKDFGSTGFSTSHEFMTNADVPTLAFADLIENPVNPFTGKIINNDEKYAHPQFILLSDEWDVLINNGNTFLPGMWASVEKDLWKAENWDYCYDDAVLYDHAMP